MEVRDAFESEQDRQLFTVRRLTINPQAQLFAPLLDLTPSQVADLLEPLLAHVLGPRSPQVVHLQRLLDVMAPAPERTGPDCGPDPFDIGDPRSPGNDFDPAVSAVIEEILAGVAAPVRLSHLLAGIDEHPGTADLAPGARRILPWTLALTVAGAYAGTAEEGQADQQGLGSLLEGRLAVLRTGQPLNRAGIGGDDLVLVPRTH
jgi:hypothetical protein